MASYKTPNGTIVEESILREKYGSRFDELVSNGTFTLVFFFETAYPKQHIIYTI